MKRSIITKTVGLTIAGFMIFGFSVAMVKNTSANITTVVDKVAIPTATIPSVELNNDGESKNIFGVLSEKLLAEKTDFLEKIQPILQDIKTKWSVLAEEMAKESPEGVKTARLQIELSALDARLAGKRLEHIMAMEKIKAESESYPR